MSSITLKKVSFGYHTENIIQDASLSFNQGDRVAIIGENGTGKSTLMKIFSGTLEPTAGNIFCDNWIEKVYISQEFTGDVTQTISLYLSQNTTNIPEANRLLSKLGFYENESKSSQDRLISNLSGGQKRMLEFATAFSRSPMFIFIDEPENHFDIVARKFIAELMSSHWGGVMFVSHDQYLVDEVSNQIIELENGELRKVSDMSYEEGQESRKRDIEADARKWQTEKKDLEKLKEAVALLKRQAEQNHKRAPSYRSRKREYDRRLAALEKNKPTTDRKETKIRINEVDQKNKKIILKSENMSFHFPEKDFLFKEVNLLMTFGQKIALIGRNGSGKSTLFNLFTGKIKPQTGSIGTGVNIIIEYFNQNHDSLDAKKSALWHCFEIGMNESKARSFLANLLFNRNESESPISSLSGGQKSKLRFALLFAKNPELLILDEPTNNLDPTMWHLLVDWLEEYTGTVLLVSHDRYFLESCNLDKYWVINHQQVKETENDMGSILLDLEN